MSNITFKAVELEAVLLPGITLLRQASIIQAAVTPETTTKRINTNL